jgi:hypothetical protein
MRDKFDIERFKRGEAAIWDSAPVYNEKIIGREDRFVAMDQHRVIVKYWKDNRLHYDHTNIDLLKWYCSMKPLEGWILLNPSEKIYWSYIDAANDQLANGMEFYKVVKVMEK